MEDKGDLLGRDRVPVVSVPGSSLWGLRSKGGLLRGEMGLALMDSAGNETLEVF